MKKMKFKKKMLKKLNEKSNIWPTRVKLRSQSYATTQLKYLHTYVKEKRKKKKYDKNEKRKGRVVQD